MTSEATLPKQADTTGEPIDRGNLVERAKSLLGVLISEDFRRRVRGSQPFAILDKRIGVKLGFPPRKIRFAEISFLDLEGPAIRPGAWEDEIVENPAVRSDRRPVLAVCYRKPDADFGLKPDGDDLFRLRNINRAQSTVKETILVLFSSTSAGETQFLFLKEKNKPSRTLSDKDSRTDSLAKDLEMEGEQRRILELLGDDYDRVYLKVPSSTLNFTNAQLSTVLQLA